MNTPAIKVDLTEIGAFSNHRQAYLAAQTYFNIARIAQCNCEVLCFIAGVGGARLNHITYEHDVQDLGVEVGFFEQDREKAEKHTDDEK